MKWRLYRVVMRLAHRFHWHYAPPIYPEGDTQLWCKWCGFRQTVRQAVRLATQVDRPADGIEDHAAGGYPEV